MRALKMEFLCFRTNTSAAPPRYAVRFRISPAGSITRTPAAKLPMCIRTKFLLPPISPPTPPAHSSRASRPLTVHRPCHRSPPDAAKSRIKPEPKIPKIVQKLAKMVMSKSYFSNPISIRELLAGPPSLEVPAVRRLTLEQTQRSVSTRPWPQPSNHPLKSRPGANPPSRGIALRPPPAVSSPHIGGAGRTLFEVPLRD
jgi:hypothetical protein